MSKHPLSILRRALGLVTDPEGTLNASKKSTPDLSGRRFVRWYGKSDAHRELARALLPYRVVPAGNGEQHILINRAHKPAATMITEWCDFAAFPSLHFVMPDSPKAEWTLFNDATAPWSSPEAAADYIEELQQLVADIELNAKAQGE